MRRYVHPAFGLVLATTLLAACGTPQERCIRTATRELRTVTALIADTEANLARGYRYEEEEVIRHAWVRCEREYISPGVPAPRRMCFEPVTQVIERPVAIDPAEEQRKLAGLKARQKELESQATAQIASCRSQFPATG